MEIRKASIKDLKDIIGLNKRLFKYDSEEFDDTLNFDWPSKNKEYFKESIINEDSIAIVVDNEGIIVGYLIGSIKEAENYRKINRIAELDNMFLLQEYRGRGIGSELCEKFIEWAKKKGLKIARVVASASNRLAISCYKKKGFKDYNLILEKEL